MSEPYDIDAAARELAMDTADTGLVERRDAIKKVLWVAQAVAWQEAIDLLVKFNYQSAALLLTKDNGVARIGR